MSRANTIVGVHRGPWYLTLSAALLLLLLLAPLAMSFQPSDAVYRDGVWAGTYVNDESYSARVVLIALGLIVTAVGVGAIVMIVRSRPDSGALLLSTSALALTATLGWCLYPYWVNGMYQAYVGSAAVLDFDPKALPPMTWIGELWRLPALVGWPLGAVVQVGALARGAWVLRGAFYRTGWFWMLGALVFIHLVAVTYLSPRYIEWLVD